MAHRLAIDFGTTNSVVAHWNSDSNPHTNANTGSAHVLTLDELSDRNAENLVPSLVYVRDGAAGVVEIGQRVRLNGLDAQRDNRLFRNFKRGIVSTTPEPRDIDGVAWSDREAGRSFMNGLLRALPYQRDEIEQLVLTAPVAAFEHYLLWLNEVTGDFAPDVIRTVDESTAAALGYAVTEPNAIVLVFDFGGGTLDLSLVQLPEGSERTGGLLRRLLSGNSSKNIAQVIAKAGRIVGGSDVDQWLLAEVLERAGLRPADLGSDYAAALTACERAKIALSGIESAELAFTANGYTYEFTITRAELETILQRNGFFTALRRVVDKVMHTARQRGIFREDIRYVLMVGGTSLMPSVQRTMREYFTETSVRTDKPFTAIAEGALRVAMGMSLDDYLAHSYGIRHLDPKTGKHVYDEIVPMGSRYPITQPIEVYLGAAHADQREVEFVVGEISTDSQGMLEVRYENGQAVFVAQVDRDTQTVIPLNADSAPIALLNPPGSQHEIRLKAEFTVDARRQLRVTVSDMHEHPEGRAILTDAVVATLR
jgi:molecular chaperone DnaK (HSP70)